MLFRANRLKYSTAMKAGFRQLASQVVRCLGSLAAFQFVAVFLIAAEPRRLCIARWT